jgi:hypothetical protein
MYSVAVLTFCQWGTLRERRVPPAPPRELIHAALSAHPALYQYVLCGCTQVLPVGDSERGGCGRSFPRGGLTPSCPPAHLSTNICTLWLCTHVLPVGDSEREEGAVVPSLGVDSRRRALYQYMYSVVVLMFCQWGTLRDRRVPQSIPRGQIHAAQLSTNICTLWLYSRFASGRL